MGDYPHIVTRLPGAPPLRAGRAWPIGDTLAADLTAAQVGVIVADPRYRIEAQTAAPKPSVTIPVAVLPKRSRVKAKP